MVFRYKITNFLFHSQVFCLFRCIFCLKKKKKRIFSLLKAAFVIFYA